MIRAELLARTTSQELTGWLALIQVHEEEREEAEDLARHKADSDDGEVIEFNKPPSRFDDEDDGTPE